MNPAEGVDPKSNRLRRQITLRVIAALWILWGMGYQTVWQRYALHIDGVVVSSKDTPSKGAPRYSTEYIIRDQDGHEENYIAGATDASIQRSMPIGTKIHKNRGELGYTMNDTWVEFPTIFYSSILALALALLIWAAVLFKNSREEK